MVELICGGLGQAGRAENSDLVQRMAASLGLGRAHVQQIWADGPVALGRVTIFPGGAPAAPPPVHHRRRVAVAADLRLPDCTSDCEAHDRLFESLAAGDFPQGLDGDFAVAVWDGDNRRLILARDRLGIRPLFFARMPSGGVAFASFPEALRDGGVVDGACRPEGMAQIALGDGPSGTQTWIEGVFRVPPGHFVVVTPKEERLRRYWRLPVDRRADMAQDHETAAHALRRALESAVLRALPERGPICTHLSGGLDSSAVTALAARVGGGPERVTAYCLTMPERHHGLDAIDEQPAAQSAARAARVSLTPVPSDSISLMLERRLAPYFIHPDDPTDSSFRLLADAAAQGADRVLCGVGGDQVVSFNGEGALLADFLAFRWRTLRRTGRELSRPLWRGLASEAASELLPGGLTRWLRRGTRQSSIQLTHSVLERCVTPAFRFPPHRSLPALGTARVQRRRLESGGFLHRLESQAWQAARHGLRYVFPLLDWRLLEFAAGLPGHLHLHGGMRRALMRTAVADLVPESILKRGSKLNPLPTAIYQIAVDRDALIAEARRVAGSPAASAVIDLAEIERQLASLPEPCAVAAAIRARAAEGAQFEDLRIASLWPFIVARALAQNEADHPRPAP